LAAPYPTASTAKSPLGTDPCVSNVKKAGISTSSTVTSATTPTAWSVVKNTSAPSANRATTLTTKMNAKTKPPPATSPTAPLVLTILQLATSVKKITQLMEPTGAHVFYVTFQTARLVKKQALTQFVMSVVKIFSGHQIR